MKKALIGCGVVLGLGLIVALVLGYFGYRKLQSMNAYMQKMVAEEQALNRDFPWLGGAHPPRPDEARLREYLAVRRASLVPFHEVTDEMDRMDQMSKSGRKPGFGDVISTGRKLTFALLTVTETYYKNLREQRMSPDEFKALTRVLYPVPGESAAPDSPPPPSPEMAGLRQRLAELDRRLSDPDLPAAERADLQPQRDAVEIQMKALQNAGPAPGAAPADALRGEIDELKNDRFDEMIVANNTGDGGPRRREFHS